jgi:ferric-dicitrate binding protein FerR (iron transport regulator)
MNKEVTYELVARYFTGNCSEGEKQKVEGWRDFSKENLLEFNHYRAIWENAKQPESTFSPNVESALTQVNRKLDLKQNDQQPSQISLAIKYIPRIAAAILVGAGIWLAYTLLRPGKDVMLMAESGNTQKEVVLKDGTHVWLNTNSMLRYPEIFRGKTRNVYIEGEAYFDVAKNAKIPFVIETDQSVVTVLGTEFNLRARKNEKLTIVTVTEGKVSFNAKKTLKQQSVYLVSGDKALLNSESRELTIEKIQDANFLSWKTGMLVFKNTPLGKVTSDLSNYFNREVVVYDSVLSQTPFTSTFDHQSLSNILNILEISLGVHVDSTGSAIVLK